MLATTLAADGFVVLPDVLDEAQLTHLRGECDALCAALQAEGVELADEGCVVEAFRRSRPAPRAAARTEPAAFAAARRAALASLCGGVDAERSAAVERALFHSLPSAVLRALGADVSRLWLFNEQHVVKPARSECEFAWHRDAEEQLALCTDVAGAPYFSVWAPLDDCGAHNGTLTVLPGFEACGTLRACAALQSLRAKPLQHATDSSRGVALDVAAGGVCVFSSALWHASGSNRSDAPRRVFYAQYSVAAVLSSHDGTPLSFAVPVGGAARASGGRLRAAAAALRPAA